MGCARRAERRASRALPPQLSLSLANCHLRTSGRAEIACTASDDTRACLAGADAHAFHTYTEFFTHSDSLCFFLHSRQWRQRTQRTVDALASTSSDVVSALCVSALAAVAVRHG